MMQDSTKTGLDVAAATITVATVLQWLPAMAALATIVWTLLRVLETRAFQAICRDLFGWDVAGWLGKTGGDRDA
ncbi:MAG: hypothetical protein WCY11_02485 [Novosphingobium sp.]